MKKLPYLLVLLQTIVFSSEGLNIRGDINLFYASKLSDYSIINLPFHISNLDLHYGDKNLDIISSFSIEYRLKEDTEFLESNNPQDFILDLKEIYFNWYTNFGEIKIGKQIHSWGMVDENSPIDNINSYDYYYLFNEGKEKRLGSLSSIIELYLDSWKFGIAISPIHNTNRIPINEKDFPVSLPASPRRAQTLSVKNPLELNLQLKKNFSNLDLSLNYFNGYDRLFNLTAAQTYNDQYFIQTVLDTVFGYRSTEMMGLGGVTFFDQLTLRFEAAKFHTVDKNEDTNRKYPNPNPFNTIEYTLDSTHIFQTDAQYYQTTLQIEYNLPFEILFSGQYFKYDTLNYKVNKIDSLKIPLFELNFDPYKYFYPGVGAPIALISREALSGNFEKLFLDKRLKLNFLFIYDLEFRGILTETIFGYSIGENANLKLVYNLSKGNKDRSEDYYPFNQLEEFSHLRMEFKYSF